MQLLILIRHSLAEEYSSQGDFFRQLTAAGTALAIKTAIGLQPYLRNKPVIVCSAALRAYQTAACMARQLNISEESIQADDFYYSASARQIYDRLQDCFQPAELLLFCGHNPAISELVNSISSLSVVLRPAEAAVIPLGFLPAQPTSAALPALVSPY
jgi:phosphohistidine phosphatase